MFSVQRLESIRINVDCPSLGSENNDDTEKERFTECQTE